MGKRKTRKFGLKPKIEFCPVCGDGIITYADVYGIPYREPVVVMMAECQTCGWRKPIE